MVDLSDRWRVFSFCDPTAAGAGAAAVVSTMAGSGSGGSATTLSSFSVEAAAAAMVVEGGSTTRGIIFKRPLATSGSSFYACDVLAFLENVNGLGGNF